MVATNVYIYITSQNIILVLWLGGWALKAEAILQTATKK